MSGLKITHPLALRLLMTDDLYLIDEQTKPAYVETEPEVADSPVFDYSGENNKYILILVHDEKHAILNSEDVSSLTAILNAKKLELRDVAIVNLHRHPKSIFEALKQFFSCSKLVLFGINPKQIGLPEISNNEITKHDGTKVLATYSFAEMATDTAKKRAFWNEMKIL
jgi:hypothetical protein